MFEFELITSFYGVRTSQAQAHSATCLHRFQQKLFAVDKEAFKRDMKHMKKQQRDRAMQQADYPMSNNRSGENV